MKPEQPGGDAPAAAIVKRQRSGNRRRPNRVRRTTAAFPMLPVSVVAASPPPLPPPAPSTGAKISRLRLAQAVVVQTIPPQLSLPGDPGPPPERAPSEGLAPQLSLPGDPGLPGQFSVSEGLAPQLSLPGGPALPIQLSGTSTAPFLPLEMTQPMLTPAPAAPPVRQTGTYGESIETFRFFEASKLGPTGRLHGRFLSPSPVHGVRNGADPPARVRTRPIVEILDLYPGAGTFMVRCDDGVVYACVCKVAEVIQRLQMLQISA